MINKKNTSNTLTIFLLFHLIIWTLVPTLSNVNLPLDKAQGLGAIMLFGEKYEDIVRMIQFNTSKELCGGTHVNATGEIGIFKILSEGSISSGIRRIEAKTGDSALDYLNDKELLLNEIGDLLKNKDLKSGVEKLVNYNKQLERELAELKKVNTSSIKEELLKSVVEVNGIKLIAKEVEMEAEDIKNVSFQIRQEEKMAMVLATKSGGKALLSVMLTDDLVARGMLDIINLSLLLRMA